MKFCCAFWTCCLSSFALDTNQVFDVAGTEYSAGSHHVKVVLIDAPHCSYFHEPNFGSSLDEFVDFIAPEQVGTRTSFQFSVVIIAYYYSREGR